MLKPVSFVQKCLLVLFGLCLTLVILELGMRLGGFAILSIQEYKNQQSIKQKGSYRIMCLGESTTQGQYPLFLEKILNQSNQGMHFSVIDKGVAGVRTESILSKLEANLNEYRPDMVVAMMGINDSGKHMPVEATCVSRSVMILRSFKVYKLVRFLWLRMETKLGEMEFFPQDTQQKAHFVEVDKSKGFPQGPVSKGQEVNFTNGATEQKQTSNKISDPNSDSDAAYMEIGETYRNEGRLAESEEAFNKVLEINPENDSAYVALGRLYQFQGASHHKYGGPEEAFKKAIKINPHNEYARSALGRFYIDSRRPNEAEQLLKEDIVINPSNFFSYIELGRLYLDQKRISESEQIFNKVLELDPGNKYAFGGLAALYSEKGDQNLFDIYALKANGLEIDHYDADTVRNYQRLKKMLDGRKIKLICVQYPMRKTEPLKSIFGQARDGGIVFVDNERIFKDVVRKEGYKIYFKDMFGGNFGHCTDKGNELLARNIANVILKEVFNKK